MKRNFTFILLAAFCIMLLLPGCSLLGDAQKTASLPPEDTLRAIVPETAAIDPDPLIAIAEEPRALATFLAGVPRIFSLDETLWELDFSGSNTDYYLPAPGSGMDESCSLSVSDEYAFLTTDEMEINYSLDENGVLALDSINFIEEYSQIDLDSEYWNCTFPYEDFTAFLTYSLEDDLCYALFIPNGYGYSVTYFPDQPEEPLLINYQESSCDENGNECDYTAYYDAETLSLSRIEYYCYLENQSIFGDDYVYATYDSDFQLLSTNAPLAEDDAENPEDAPPATTDAPASTPESLPEETEDPTAGSRLWAAFWANDPDFWNQLKELF